MSTDSGSSYARIQYTEQQSEHLQKIFDKTPFIDNKVKLQLANELQVKPKQIQTWFQNRRARCRRLKVRQANRSKTYNLDSSQPGNSWHHIQNLKYIREISCVDQQHSSSRPTKNLVHTDVCRPSHKLELPDICERPLLTTPARISSNAIHSTNGHQHLLSVWNDNGNSLLSESRRTISNELRFKSGLPSSDVQTVPDNCQHPISDPAVFDQPASFYNEDNENVNKTEYYNTNGEFKSQLAKSRSITSISNAESHFLDCLLSIFETKPESNDTSDDVFATY